MGAYYNRTMSSSVEGILNAKFNWMIKYVKDHSELDFQTGSNNASSWFSIYRGTGCVLKISSSGKVSADKKYKALFPQFYIDPTPERFDQLLSILNQTEFFDKYYAKKDLSNKKEGYYQTLIARRYTFNNKPEDDFIIIDKEMVIGFDSKETETKWNEPISKSLDELIENARAKLAPTKLPEVIKNKYGEFDFLGLNWNGDIIIMELKQNDPQKTYLSAVQACYYFKQLTKLYGEIDNLYDNIISMINQKISLGLLKIPKGRTLPTKLSGKIRTYLIVGEDADLSKEICKRFKMFRHEILPDMEAYTCKPDGTLIRSAVLEDCSI